MRMALLAFAQCCLGSVAFLVASLAGPAFSKPLARTDVNPVTAIDESASVGRHGEWLQYNGMAQAVMSSLFLEAVRDSGVHRRIGFVVVAWSSHGNVRLVVPWMVIASEADAFRAAGLIERSSRVDRSSWEDQDETGVPRAADELGWETDISAVIDAAISLIDAAPFLGERGVINILANGRDNVESGPQMATQRAVSLGLTVNGIVFGNDQRLAEYFRRHVIGGAGAFVESVNTDPRTFEEIMLRKFLRDLLW